MKNKVYEVPKYHGSDGHVYVNLLCTDNKYREYKLCRVIWYYFRGEIPDGYDVSHIDGDKENNRLDNLKLVKITE